MGFFGVAPAPFCVGSLFSLLAKRKSGRGICVSSLFFGFCLSVFLYGYASFFEAKVFHTFCTLFNRFSHCQDRALERDRPQQREKKAARTCCASRFATLQLEHECQLIPFSLCASQVRLLLSRSLYRSHVLTTFLGPVLGVMTKQVCWHSRRSKAYRGLPEARGQSEAHGDSNLYNTLVGVP